MEFLKRFPSQEDEIGHEDQAEGAEAVDLTLLAAENNDFAVALYKELRRTAAKDTFVFSPFSIRVALAMARAGAVGKTADEMDETLRITSSGETPHETFQAALARYKRVLPELASVVVANSMWVQAGMTIREQFREVASRDYDSSVQVVDFENEPRQVSQAINMWAEEQTRGRIPELAPTALESETRLVLANAIYFKDNWARMFEQNETRIGDYFPGDGKPIRVPFMRQTEPIRYARRASYQAIDLGFRSDRFSFLVILPDQRDGLRELETQLTAMEILDCVQHMRTREVALSLPKFTFRFRSPGLKECLSVLGMPTAFDRREADFSGINDCRPPDQSALWISQVMHSTFISVNEAGVEAAAATAVSFVEFCKIPSPLEFRVNHPFLFVIRDARNGTILFLGRVWNPPAHD